LELEDEEGSTAASVDSLSLLDLEPVENMVVIPVPAPCVIVHTLVPINVPQEFIPPILCGPNPLEMEAEGLVIAWAQSSPSPTYFENWEDDLMVHSEVVDGVLKFWANLD
jgi:hypothetical protein